MVQQYKLHYKRKHKNDMQQLHKTLERKISRQEFLTISGLAVGSILGFGTVIKLLTGQDLKSRSTTTGLAHGYGASSYGR